MRALDYAGRVRDTKTERELAIALRQVPEREAFTFILEMLDVNLAVALDLANKTLRDRQLLRSLFDRGLSLANASTIRFWLDSLLPRLGFREIVRILREHLDVDPAIVGQARYFLPPMAANPAEITLMKELQADVDAKLSLGH